jgi:DNA-binding MarR family transcriptional regulator
MHRIVAHLESAGLVSREPHPEVGRRLDATLTPAGRVEAVEARLVAGLATAEREQLVTLLERCQL